MPRLRSPLLTLLALLVLAWGTCPCFYADVLSAGAVRCEVAQIRTSGCEQVRTSGCEQVRTSGCEQVRTSGCEQVCTSGCETNCEAPCDNDGDRCPCQDAFGCMHPLPQVKDSRTLADLPASPCLIAVDRTPVLAPIAVDSGALPGATPPPPPPAHPLTDILLV